jgi:hypothetical protein
MLPRDAGKGAGRLPPYYWAAFVLIGTTITLAVGVLSSFTHAGMRDEGRGAETAVDITPLDPAVPLSAVPQSPSPIREPATYSSSTLCPPFSYSPLLRAQNWVSNRVE